MWPMGLEGQSIGRKSFSLNKKWCLGNLPLFFGQMLLCSHVTLEAVAAVCDYDGLRMKPRMLRLTE